MRFAHGVFLFGLVLSLGRPAQSWIWPSQLERMKAVLAEGTPEARLKVVESLDSAEDGSANSVIVKALADPDSRVRLVAARIAQQRHLRIASTIAPWLADPDPALREAALRVLVKDPVPATEALARVLVDPSPELRRLAAIALGYQHATAAVDVLLGRIDDDVGFVRLAVVEALGRHADSRSILALSVRLADVDPEVRRAAVWVVGRMGAQGVGSFLSPLLKDSDPRVRAAALLAYSRVGEGDVAQRLADHLTADTPLVVVKAAARGLRNLRTAEAMTALVVALSRVRSKDRIAAIASQIRGAGEMAQNAIGRCLLEGTSREIEGCLDVVTERNAALSLVQPLLSRPEVHRPAVLRALGALASTDALVSVLPYLSAPDPESCRASYDALEMILEKGAAGGLAVDPLSDRLRMVGLRSPEAPRLLGLLGRTGSPRALKLLLDALRRSTSNQARVAALDGMGRPGTHAFPREPVIDLLLGPDAELSVHAQMALFRSPDPSSLGLLLDRIHRWDKPKDQAILVVLSSSLAGAKDSATLERVGRLLEEGFPSEREAILEGMALGSLPRFSSQLREWVAHGNAWDRAKIAEALARGEGAEELLRHLARDADRRVRANAAWSLGRLGSVTAISTLTELALDSEAAVSNNALVALGRVGKRTGSDVRDPLCSGATGFQPSQRLAALEGLRVAGQRCRDGREREALMGQGSVLIEEAAARLLVESPSQPDDGWLVDRCYLEHPRPSVVSLCQASMVETGSDTGSRILVIVGGLGRSAQDKTPFALRRPDGLIRLGWTDRRGMVLEPDMAQGEAELLPFDLLSQ